MPAPRFIYWLNVAHRRLESAFQGDSGGKTAVRAGLLLALPKDGTRLPTAQLGATLDVSPSTLSGLVDRMARDGLIERHADPADGRASQIALTPSGGEARAEAVRVARTLNDILCEGFDEAELAIIERWLQSAYTKFSGKNPSKKI